MVEFAVVSPVLFILVFGILVGGLGVSRFQQIAAVAREGSRWASVHGAEYAAQTGNTAATPAQICTQGETKAPGLPVSCTVTYNPPGDNHQTHTETLAGGVQVTKANTVSVAVTYVWTPEFFSFISPKTMRSTSVTVMSF